jgi:pilus assembly protein CpaF
VAEIGVVRRAGDLVTVEPAWRADGRPVPARERLVELLAPAGGEAP